MKVASNNHGLWFRVINVGVITSANTTSSFGQEVQFRVTFDGFGCNGPFQAIAFGSHFTQILLSEDGLFEASGLITVLGNQYPQSFSGNAPVSSPF